MKFLLNQRSKSFSIVKIFKGPDGESTQKEWTLKSFCCVSFKNIGNIPDQFEGSLVDRHLPSTVAEHDDLRRGLRIRVSDFFLSLSRMISVVWLYIFVFFLHTVCGGGGAWGGKTYVKLPLIFLSFVGENHVNCILNIYKLERHSFSASRKAAAVERVFCCTDVCLKVSGWGALSHFTHHADARYQCGGEENTVGLGSVWSVFGGKCDLEVFFPGFLEFGGSKVNQTLECGNLDVFKRFRTFNGNHEAVEVWTYIGESPNFKHLRNSNKTFFKNLHLRFVETQQIG